MSGRMSFTLGICKAISAFETETGVRPLKIVFPRSAYEALLTEVRPKLVAGLVGVYAKFGLPDHLEVDGVTVGFEDEEE